MTHHLIAATRMLDAQLDITLVVHATCVRELVGLEMHQGCCFACTVLKFSHNFIVLRTPEKDSITMNRAQFSNLPLPIDQALLAPPQAISDKTLCDMHPVNILKRKTYLKNILGILLIFITCSSILTTKERGSPILTFSATNPSDASP